MKKIAICFMVVMMFCSSFAVGESIDELTLLLSDVYAEIDMRYGFSDNLIGTGTYIVGVDINPGKYELICLSPQIITSASGSV